MKSDDTIVISNSIGYNLCTDIARVLNFPFNDYWNYQVASWTFHHTWNSIVPENHQK